MVPDASIALAAVTLMVSNAGGRPPIRPRARLAASAVRVRSRKSSTSNCAWIAPDGRAGQPPAHHPRGQTPRQRQAVGDPLGCRSPIPRTPARTRQHGARRSDHRRIANRSRREHSRQTSEVSQNSFYPDAIGRVVLGYSSGMACQPVLQRIRVVLGSSRKRPFIGDLPI